MVIARAAPHARQERAQIGRAMGAKIAPTDSIPPSVPVKSAWHRILCLAIEQAATHRQGVTLALNVAMRTDAMIGHPVTAPRAAPAK